MRGPVSAETRPTGLLLCRDLIFTTKVKETAMELGYWILVAGTDSSARSLLKTQGLRVVFIDLTAGEVAAPGAVSEYRKLASPDAPFVAFGPHVEAGTLAAARAAGCQTVMPRSKFAAELPELLRHYIGAAGDA